MITFSQIGNLGRLGNQLFQCAILKVISLKKKYEIVLPKNSFDRYWHGQKCLLENFKLPSFSLGNISVDKIYKETIHGGYDKSILDLSDNTDILGFFQNPLYYSGLENELREEFSLKNSLEDNALNYISKFNSPVVSLHVRRGDLSNGNCEKDKIWANDSSPDSILNKYYSSALNCIPSNSTILLFTGGSRDNNIDDDLNWCKKNFKDNRIIFVDETDTIKCFSIMKNCHYNITSFASSFSWWASFLNKNNNIIAPKIYYPSCKNLDSSQVFPSNWNFL